MPRIIDINGVGPSKVATEAELLAFANKVRQAGGAGVLDALLPSAPEEPASCLIANALNFHSLIEPLNPVDEAQPLHFKGGARMWVMIFPANMSEDRIRHICKSVGCRPRRVTDEDGNESLGMQLPEHIGNAAKAFDTGDAFQEYVR